MAVLVLGGFIIGAIFLYSVINLIRGKEWRPHLMKMKLRSCIEF